jgi:Putative peptidoglycan binding domain/Glycosyl hydrolase family 46
LQQRLGAFIFTIVAAWDVAIATRRIRRGIAMRTWFDYSPPNRAVRGGLVIDMQLPLARLGHLASVDGIYARQTAQAIRQWQGGKGFAPTGAVDELTWQGLTGSASPPLFRRCLALTAAFEGHGYTLAVGNFDGAYLTWGIIGFTLKHGNFGEVIRTIQDRHPALLTETIGGDKAKEILDIAAAPAVRQKAFADSITLSPSTGQLRADWKDAFEILGNRKEARAIQDEIAKKVYWSRAVRDMKQFGKMTEIDAALFFDTSVQNGGVDPGKAAAIKKALAALPRKAATRERLKATAGAIASGSKPEYRNDVLSRRQTIALGTGNVHGADYRIGVWGLNDMAIGEVDTL